MTRPPEPFGDICVIAPNLKRTYSGVTSTVIALLPIQRRDVAIVAAGWGLPADLPQIPLSALPRLVRTRPSRAPFRIWHARRNVEMIAGLVLRAVTRAPMKLVFTSAAQRRHTPLTRWLIGRMDGVIATSEKAARYLDVAPTIIPHGIDVATYRPARPGDRDPASVAAGGEPARWVGCFGRVRENKGTDLFVDAMISVMGDHPDLRAVVLGRITPDNARFADGLRARIAAAGLQHRFLIPGELERGEVVAWYRRLALFVAPQRWEGFGLTVPEAMASGTPVVASDVGAAASFVTSGQVGRLVAPGDGAALEAAIREVLADPGRLAEMGRAARAQAEVGFAIEREAEAINALYRRLWEAG